LAAERNADVIVAGGGPAGSTLAWDLARRGVRVVLLERARFPREKVCGDYVEPRGLRILKSMGCLERLEAGRQIPITDSATFVDWECRYSGKVPFYGLDGGLPPHGYVIPREELDDVMLDTAARAGATIHYETAVTSVDATPRGVEIEARRGARTVRYRAKLVAGADGANSVVGKAQGLAVDDERHTAVAQRAYATIDGDVGEAAFFFDEDVFPGYGWMFPIAGGCVNLGVGILSETRRRLDVHVPALFGEFVERLQQLHPRCARLELSAPPIGGVVKTYGGVGPNYFDGGVLVGDAGSFVDPMTAEGITPAMESALLASPVLTAALDAGRFDSDQLSAYETAFRSYFDPAMTFLDFCAAVVRNRHMARPWLKALGRGCDLAQADPAFARTSASYFGGLDIRPFGILGQMSMRVVQDLALAWPRFLVSRTRSGEPPAGTTVGDFFEWQSALSRSLLSDPLWHSRWTVDVQRKWVNVLSTAGSAAGDPRFEGVVEN
jgi:geranylgeranyl reductase family protein